MIANHSYTCRAKICIPVFMDRVGMLPIHMVYNQIYNACKHMQARLIAEEYLLHGSILTKLFALLCRKPSHTVIIHVLES